MSSSEALKGGQVSLKGTGGVLSLGFFSARNDFGRTFNFKGLIEFPVFGIIVQ